MPRKWKNENSSPPGRYSRSRATPTARGNPNLFHDGDNFAIHLLRYPDAYLDRTTALVRWKISQLRSTMRTYPNYGVQLRHRDLFRPINSSGDLLLVFLGQKGQDLSDDRVQSLRYFGLQKKNNHLVNIVNNKKTNQN